MAEWELGNPPCPNYYKDMQEQWMELEPVERAAIVAEANAQGGGINQYGQLYFQYIRAGVDKYGRPNIMLLPRVHRADALRGDEQAQRYCELKGIPWRHSDVAFDRWERTWIAAKLAGQDAPVVADTYHGDPEKESYFEERQRKRARQARLPYKES